ncbi:hypothetical protein DCAR_0727316 [Daucus carota subsp. sativus]|uniref:LysM domain-containing protein n=1 Tax=Daucus carota subsp. sativus TaxID=79200 RepID=A0AAF1B8K3_DAUCS|nr:hypothetical protein DCAR_0727316 [Daucus carota subsp. sativus]
MYICVFRITLALALFPLQDSVFRAVPVPAGPTCDTVFGVRKGDTCFDIAQNFKLSAHDFNCINPNVNCAALFVGQWVCISSCLPIAWRGDRLDFMCGSLPAYNMLGNFL